jgi:hypothetical protein
VLSCSASTSPEGSGPGGLHGAGNGVLPGAPGAGSQPGSTASGTSTNGAAPSFIDGCSATLPGGPGASEIDALARGGPGNGMRWLYPYERTVFPRGLLAPTLMWEGADAEFIYVRIHSSTFEYKACLAPTAPGQFLIPKDAWDAASAHTLGPQDPFSIELTTLAGGVAAGPITRGIIIAQASINGSIFYNTYSSRLASAAGAQGVVLRIPAGGKAELFVANECNGCHSVSADGSRMLSQTLLTGGRSYPLAPGAAANPTAMNAGPRTAFGALYPDGSLYLSTSTQTEVARAAYSAIGSSEAAELFETDTGSLVSSSGIPEGALMPTFSTDGKLLVFNDFALNEAHGLALMDFDVGARRASGHRVLFMDQATRPGWPFVLPDNRAVLFTRTDGVDFSGQGAGIAGTSAISGMPGNGGGNPGGGGSPGGGGGTDIAGFVNGIVGAVLPGGIPSAGGSPSPPRSDLYMVDIVTGKTVLLARAMGYDSESDAAGDVTYLPFGGAELHMNYFPTVAPVGAGGYFWIFFDSVRHYGGLGLQRQLWGAAIEIAADGNYAVDRSQPAFYLPGQEFGTGNHRAFAAMDPCRDDGDSCTSGVDCCGGFCWITEPATDAVPEPTGRCSSDVPVCAKTGERCNTSADCCAPSAGHPADSCIAGVCTQLFLPD